MLVVTCVGFLSAIQLAASSTQNAPLTKCPGTGDPALEITSIRIKDAKLGKDVQFDGTFVVDKVVGVKPVMQLSFARSDGTKLPCIPIVMPCNLKLCNAITRREKVLNADWGNKCPVQPGTYNAHLDFNLPDNLIARLFLGVSSRVNK
ncbi:hypothetical protein V5799_028944 [Amblyomma americanum]|uniref:MD-2-related lipid-recognition domain-containing protein n=1 Tax=Amblyomma americanum TaxID=6943 RepID=A0AAQ4DBE6_AMBAM